MGTCMLLYRILSPAYSMSCNGKPYNLVLNARQLAGISISSLRVVSWRSVLSSAAGAFMCSLGHCVLVAAPVVLVWEHWSDHQVARFCGFTVLGLKVPQLTVFYAVAGSPSPVSSAPACASLYFFSPAYPFVSWTVCRRPPYVPSTLFFFLPETSSWVKNTVDARLAGALCRVSVTI